MRKFAPLLICFSLASPGCYLFTPIDNGTPTPNVEVTPQISFDIRDSLKDATEEDCKTLWGLTSGLALYTEKQQTLKTSGQIRDLLDKAAIDLGWTAGRYVKFTDTVEVHLISLKLDDNKALDNETKTVLVKAWKDISNGCQLAIEAKGRK